MEREFLAADDEADVLLCPTRHLFLGKEAKLWQSLS